MDYMITNYLQNGIYLMIFPNSFFSFKLSYLKKYSVCYIEHKEYSQYRMAMYILCKLINNPCFWIWGQKHLSVNYTMYETNRTFQIWVFKCFISFKFYSVMI